MHYIQQRIFHQLAHQSSLRYSELKPVEMEGNIFMYHLRSLMKAGYVEKGDDGRYRLTSLGAQYAEGLSMESMKPRLQPKIVTLLVCRNAAGEYLFLRRKKQPLFGLAGFPYGKLHMGETVAEAAARELKEKTGLSCDLTHRGDGYITTKQTGQPTSEIMFHLFYGENPTGQLITESKLGSAFWAPQAQIDHTFMPSVTALLSLLKESPERFFAELNYEI
jgi:ADP-ribose pyrophosphatase YjhB (NUDIX family)